MSSPRPSWNEEDRLKLLDSYGILDTQIEEDFERIVKMAAEVCHVPISLISFVSSGRQWFKAAFGTELKETPLNQSICSHAILQNELLVVPDTTKDDRTADNPLVSGDPNVRFYAGAVLQSPEGLPLGTVCVLDFKPRTLTPREADTLNALARQVMTLLELRRALAEKSRSESALREREEAFARIAAVIESSDDAIVTKSLEGIILSWNAGAERIFGYTPDEIIGRSILQLIPAELQGEEPVIIERLKKGERIDHYETVRVGKGGRRVDISLTVSPVKDRLGKIVAASKIARDITEEKKRQQALREGETRFRTELERLVVERTASLQETIAELEAFSYSISHDMRAPLRSMISYAEILKEDCGPMLDAAGIEYLNRISKASRRMDQLIQDILVFSRLGRDQVVLQPIDTDVLLRDILHSYPNLHPDLVTVTIKGALPTVMGHEALLTQCFSNLLDNGVKFAAKGTKPQIEIWSESTGGIARLYFKDSGIGMPSHHLERIFDIFHRVGRDNEGTGIGLAIVRKSAEKMGGTVGVKSDLGKGSLFWLDLKTA